MKKTALHVLSALIVLCLASSSALAASFFDKVGLFRFNRTVYQTFAVVDSEGDGIKDPLRAYPTAGLSKKDYAAPDEAPSCEDERTGLKRQVAALECELGCYRGSSDAETRTNCLVECAQREIIQNSDGDRWQ
jgi:hypothetical protein